MKLSQAAATVTALARAIRTYWEVELPNRHPDYPVIRIDEDSGPPPAQTCQLKQFLAGLPPDIIYKLLLVMYLGRGDFGTAGLAAQFAQIKTTFREVEWAISQMMEKVPLADYLSDGMEILRREKINPDKLFIKLSNARK